MLLTAIHLAIPGEVKQCTCSVAVWHFSSGFEYKTFVSLQVVRLSSQDVPTAYAYELEAATIVQPEQVIDAVKRVVPKYALA